MDYRQEARRFARLSHGIIDAHAHVNGARASVLLREAMDLYGIDRIWSMTALEQVPVVREVPRWLPVDECSEWCGVGVQLWMNP